LQATGGLVMPRAFPGRSFTTYESAGGREYSLGRTILPCDPTETSGYAYLPKSSLIVAREANGRSLVVGDREAFVVRSARQVRAMLAKEEKFVAQHRVVAESWQARAARWWRHAVLGKPYLQRVFSDGRTAVYFGSTAGGTLGELVLTPSLGIMAAPPNADAANVAPAGATSLPGALEIIRYLTSFQKPVLEDLASFAKPSG
ncbi:MAG: hypothetical protein KGR26_12040, partial [Cyanobacteria bacterium REEB65]|nr:hypothetical protein [Cyanobacteria bacterium REEB65]